MSIKKGFDGSKPGQRASAPRRAAWAAVVCLDNFYFITTESLGDPRPAAIQRPSAAHPYPCPALRFVWVWIVWRVARLLTVAPVARRQHGARRRRWGVGAGPIGDPAAPQHRPRDRRYITQRVNGFDQADAEASLVAHRGSRLRAHLVLEQVPWLAPGQRLHELERSLRRGTKMDDWSSSL